MNANETMQKTLETAIAKLEETRKALSLLPDLGEHYALADEICFQVHIPYNLETANEIIAKLAAAGWVEQERYNREWAGDA